MSSIAGMVKIEDVSKIYNTINEKLTEHLLKCMNCKPEMRCLQYVSLVEIRDNLKWVEVGNDQKN